MNCVHHVRAPERSLGRGARPPGCRERRTPLMPLGLDEQVGERRMGAVGVRRREHHLAVARELDLPHLVAVVRHGDAPDLRGILRHDGDLRPGLDVAVGAVEGHAVRRQLGAIPVRARAHRLVAGGPDAIGGQVAHVDELPRVVAGPVRTPARHRELAVPAVARPAVADHDRVREAAQQRDARLRGLGGLDLAHRRALELRIGERLVHARHLRRLEHEAPRDPLVQQQLGGADERVRVEAPLPDPVLEQVRQRHHRHADVVGHERAHERVPPPRFRPGVVERIVEPEVAEGVLALELREVVERALGIHHHRERGGVGRDHEVAAEPALQREIRHPERAVLIREVTIAEVVRALAHPPRDAALLAVGHVPADGAAVRLVEDRLRERLHHERRHEVLEHAAAPGDERHLAGGARERAPEVEPVRRRHLVVRDRDEAREPGLGGQEVVVRRVQRVRPVLVADGEELARGVEQEAEVHPEREAVRPVRDRLQACRQPGVPGEAQARLPDADEMAGEVAAVDRGDVRRLEHAQLVQLVPVEEVAAEAPHPLERLEHPFEPRGHVLERDEAEVVRTDDGEELEADVRRGGPHRRDAGGVLLHIVGREPVRLRVREGVEVAPVQRRVAQRLLPLRGRQGTAALRPRAARGVRDRGGERPQQRERAGGDGELPRRRRVLPRSRRDDDQRDDRERQGDGGPHPPPDVGGRAGQRALGLGRRLPLEEVAPGHDQPPQRAEDRVGGDDGLVRKEGDRQRDLLRARHGILPDGRIVCAPGLVERRPQERHDQRHDPRRGDRAQPEQRPAQRRSRDQGPPDDEQQELRQLDGAAAEVVEDLPA